MDGFKTFYNDKKGKYILFFGFYLIFFIFLAIYMRSMEAKKITDATYYTPYPLTLSNNFTKIIKKVPKMFKTVSFDEDKFIKRKDILFENILKELSFQDSITQFEDDMEVQEQLYSFPRFEMANYALKDATHKIGLNAYNIPNVIIPNPFKLSHFKIGTILDLDSQSVGFIVTDIKLLVVGWKLQIRQGNGIGGGAAYTQTLSLRTAALSWLSN